MPQLDILILFSTSYENTLLFWLLYFFLVKFFLSKLNNIFNIRKKLKNYYLFNDILILKNLYIINILYLKTHVYNILLNYIININNIIYFKSLIIINYNMLYIIKNITYNITNYCIDIYLYNFFFNYQKNKFNFI